jgi:hypothetical protein
MLMATTYSIYSTSPTPQQSFYRNGDDGIIFEFTAIDVSKQFLDLPNFDSGTTLGFTNVSAIATIPIETTKLNNLFYFEGKNYGNDTTTIIPVMYGINTSYKFNVSYSNASLTYGAINSLGEPPIKSDYVNYLAYAITGGYNFANIFANERLLIDGVANMDTSFNNTINDSISSIKTNYSTLTSDIIDITNASVFFDTAENNSIYIQSCKSLLDGLLSIPNTVRGDKFFTDIEAQNNEPINADAISTSRSYYYIKFFPGDIVSVVLKYIPTNGNATSIIGDNLVYTRSYKILLKCV